MPELTAQVVRALIAAGAPLDIKDDEGRTALHRAAKGGHLEICEHRCIVAYLCHSLMISLARFGSLTAE